MEEGLVKEVNTHNLSQLEAAARLLLEEGSLETLEVLYPRLYAQLVGHVTLRKAKKENNWKKE